MVCSLYSLVDGRRLATPPATPGSDVTSGQGYPKPPAGRMEHIRESFKSQGLSDQASGLVIESWRSKTNRSYDSLFRRWDRWCNQRGSNPFSGPVREVANHYSVIIILARTKPLRGEETRLFVSFIQPHTAVTSSSIARWLKTIQQEGGIDTKIIGAHSKCGASTSAAAKGGIATTDILKAANWSLRVSLPEVLSQGGG